MNITPNGTFLWILPNPAFRLNAAPIYSSKEVKVFFGLLRMKVDAARPKIASVAAKVATAAKAAAAKVPSKAVIKKPATSTTKNSAKATVTGLKPGQKVKVTVNVRPKP